MKWFRNLSTMLKILALVMILIALMLIISFKGYNTSARIAQDIEQTYENYAKPAMNMLKARSLAVENRRMVLSMFNTLVDSELKSYAERVTQNRAAIADLVKVLNPELLSPEAKKVHSSLLKTGPEYRKFQDEAIDGALEKIPRALIVPRLTSTGDIGWWENEYADGFAALTEFLIQKGDEATTIAKSEATRGGIQIAYTSTAAVLLGILLSIFVSKTITGPINKIQNSVNLFAEGDLASKFSSHGRDELAVMGRALQNMADKLKDIIGSVKNASRHIMETSHDFSALAQETSASVQEFRSNVDEMGANLDSLAATGEEVNASVEEVASGAQTTAGKGTDIATKVDDAMRAGDNGMEFVRKAVTGIESVVDNASATAKSVQELGDRANQIQGFVSQINDIAEQTNLLALNAAIEAARAGEAGRGFAVVAEEVRKLAEDSNVAAKNIEGLAMTIKTELNKVVDMSWDNAKASEEAKEISRKTEEILENMISYLSDIAGETQDLAAISQEQAASSEEIAEAVESIATRVRNAADAGENIRSGAGEVSNAADRIAVGSEGLSKLVEELDDLLEFFKMERTTLPLASSTDKSNNKFVLKG
ncbi:MAG: methyl-accepting chemotaxis protein [Synergistaceae bacterium]|jgi:methyl-accepting chemotaxis protein|nr:methyl-accepting chemotaxis protein [Synergistaceae bacterium]